MSIYKIFLHSFVMALLNILSVTTGHFTAKLFPAVNHYLIQIPTATVMTVLGFLLWDYMLRKFDFEKIVIKKRILFYIYTFAFAFSPLLYFPFQMIFPDVANDFGNVAGLWMFQLAGNLIIVFLMILLELREASIIEEYAQKKKLELEKTASKNKKKSGKKPRKHKPRGSKKKRTDVEHGENSPDPGQN